MSKQVGLDMKLYYNSNTFASPTWVLIDNCRDLSAPDVMNEADVSRRASAVKQFEPTLRDFSIDWQMVYDATDTPFSAMRTRYAAKTLTELALADGLIATTGTIYFRIECKIFKFQRNESLSDANLYDLSAKPCYSANAPTLVTV